MTEAQVQNSIYVHLYLRGVRDIFRNASRGLMGEADVLSITRAGFAYEFEVKLSRSDFLKDFKTKKEKHEILKAGALEWKQSNFFRGDYSLKTRCPNYFSFVVPEGLVKPEEVPNYYGLYYVTGERYNVYNWKSVHSLTQVRKPKRLHKAAVEDGALSKLYQVFFYRMNHYIMDGRLEK